MKSGYVWTIFTVLALNSFISESSKILLIPYHHNSHVRIFAKLGQALEDNGHEGFIMTVPLFEDKVKKTTLTPMVYPVSENAMFQKRLGELMSGSVDGSDVGDAIIAETFQGFSQHCHEIMENQALMSQIEKEKFDLVIIDGTMCQICKYMIPYKFDIPFITVHGFQVTAWASGVTGMPSIEPELEHPFSNRMNFWERLENFKAWMALYDHPYSAAHSEEHMNKYCPPHKPKMTLKELQKKSEMFLMNFEIYCLDYPRTMAPNTQYLGPSTATEAKPLPKDLEAFVNSSPHGIIVMSLGSMKAWQWVWKTIREKMFAAFARLPQKVIVQYSMEGDVGKVPDNVKLMEWLPQNDLLGHPKTKLFVTHGGNNGQNEAVFHGIPMLVIPITIDQPYAGVRVEAHGYGKHVKDKDAATADELYHMMNDIITNKSYAENIKKCSAIVRSLPTSDQTFVFWVNHILKFGGDHLRPPSLDMPLYQVLMLDIVAYYAVQYLVGFHLVLFFLYFIYTRCIKGKKSKKD